MVQILSGFQVLHINGVLCEKSVLRCGVSLRSILGSLLFLIADEASELRSEDALAADS